MYVTNLLAKFQVPTADWKTPAAGDLQRGQPRSTRPPTFPELPADVAADERLARATAWFSETNADSPETLLAGGNP